MRGLLSKPVHPILFAVYPVVFLLQQNIDEMSVTESFRAAAAAGVFGLIVWGMTRAVVRDGGKAAAIATLLIACTFLYADYSDSRWTIAVVAFSAVVAAAAIALSRWNWTRGTQFLNSVAVLLVLASVVQIAPYAVARNDGQTAGPESAAAGSPAAAAADSPSPGSQLPEHLRGLVGTTPNIYYIVLDGYGRADILERFYVHDNAPFIDFLRAQGFYVADSARSNYARTTLSLASTLNFTHLLSFVEKNNLIETRDMRPFVNLMKQNRVFHFVKQFGYTTHAYSSTMLNYQADHLRLPETTLSYFENEVVARTPFKVLLHRVNQLNAFRIHHTAVKQTIAALYDAVDADSPKFVLAHIVCPHPPFVFDRNGEYREPRTQRIGLTDGDSAVGADMSAEEYREQYAIQLEWLNGEVMKWVEHVRRADPRAVIVLQGDHGPGSMFKWNSIANSNMLERFSILNALCLPEGGEETLYPEISPVNTFRVIFNRYFGMQYELVPDQSFFSESRRPFLLYEVHFDAPKTEP